MSADPILDLDLGPRALAVTPEHPFALSPQQVDAINDYVREVRIVWDSVPDDRIPPELKEMVTACDRWDSDTRPLLRDVADGIAEYGQRTAPERYGELEQVLPALGNPLDLDARSRFQGLLSELVETCRRAAEGARQALDSASGFSDSMSRAEQYIRTQLAARKGGEIQSWQDLLWKAVQNNHSDPRAALAATQTIWGAWQSLYTDLLGARETTAHLLDTKVPFLVRVRVDLALTQWRELGEGAWAFRLSIT
ncbi:MAG TPA: hypothetical protein VFS67_08400 [Polyangiaceae bacterium]|jgi:hypothetical protein|nr:hypothetical protein [Polyangiaceae bacterium]